MSKQRSADMPSPISITAQLQIIFEAGRANMGPSQVHPAEGALFTDGVNIYLGAGEKEVHFCKFKK